MVRSAAVAGQFYAAKAPTLRAEVERCFLSPIGPGHLPKVNQFGPRNIIGAQVPHAGLIYSGPVAAHVFNALAEDGLPETAIIIGPNHHGVGRGVAVSDEDFMTPFGQVSSDRSIISKLKGVVELDRSAHFYEHSIEVQLPFLQYLKPDIKIVPIAMGFQDYETAKELAASLKGAIQGKDVIILASSDMSHYVSPKVAQELDSKVLDKVVAMDAKGVYDTVLQHDVSMCGFGPVMSMLMACEGGKARLMKYATSGDVHPMQQVVGYAGVVVTK